MDTELARTRAQGLLDFVQGQMKALDGGDKGGSAALAAGKIFELLKDYGRAHEAYESALAESPEDIEAQARKITNAVKSGQSVSKEAETLARSNPDGTFPNLVFGEPLSVWSVLASAKTAEGDKDQALDAWKRAADQGDPYARNNLSALEKGALEADSSEVPAFVPIDLRALGNTFEV